MPRARRAAAPLLLALALAGCDGAPPPAGAPAGEDRVRFVVDGDTVELARAGRARIIGIDAPEVDGPYTRAECFGPEASALLERLLPEGARVRVERGVRPRDRFGRALVHLGRDGRDVGAELLRAGAVRPLAIRPDVARAGRYAALADAARRAGRGLWGAACRT